MLSNMDDSYHPHFLPPLSHQNFPDVFPCLSLTSCYLLDGPSAQVVVHSTHVGLSPSRVGKLVSKALEKSHNMILTMKDILLMVGIFCNLKSYTQSDGTTFIYSI